jgi:hypothetical protein
MSQKGTFLRQHFKYFDMIFDYIRQFEGVMLMTGRGKDFPYQFTG